MGKGYNFVPFFNTKMSSYLKVKNSQIVSSFTKKLNAVVLKFWFFLFLFRWYWNIYWQYRMPLTKVKYTLSILQIYWKYTSKVYLKHTSSILEAYFKYTSSILQVYFNLINYKQRSILQVYIISTKKVHLKHILWN